MRMAEHPLADGPNVRRRKLGIELRRHREALNLRQREAADELEWSLSKLIRIEAGAHGVSVSDLKSMVDVYGITDKEQAAALMAIARGSRGHAWWWNSYRDIVPPTFARYLDYEAMASCFRIFHPFLIPGLLQSREYATELLKVLPNQAATPQRVALRMERQERVFAQPGVAFTFIMGEEALYRLVGGSRVMRRQFEHLLEVGRRENVEFRIVPFGTGAFPGMFRPFNMFRLIENDEDVLFQESPSGDQLVRDDPEAISMYAEYFETMIEISLQREQCEALLGKQIDRLSHSEHRDTESSESR